MNRDELLETVLGSPSEDLPAPAKWLTTLEQDETDTNVQHARAVIGLAYRRVLVRDSVSPGIGVSSAWTTLSVATILHVATEPGQSDGYAKALVLSAHEEARSHRSLDFCCVLAGDADLPFFETLGYQHPDGTPAGFLVFQLGEREWPSGSVRTLGSW